MRRYFEIENHVEKLKIKGYENRTLKLNRIDVPMEIVGIADGKKFRVATTGFMKIGEIVEKIVEQVTNEH